MNLTVFIDTRFLSFSAKEDKYISKVRYINLLELRKSNLFQKYLLFWWVSYNEIEKMSSSLFHAAEK